MGKYTHALIMSDYLGGDEGNITLIDNVDNLLANPQDFGVCGFYEDFPNDSDVGCWKDGWGVLVKIELVVPNIVATSWSL